MRTLFGLIALVILALPARAPAQIPLLTLTYHVEGCAPETGLLLQPVFVCGHTFQAVPGLNVAALSRDVVVHVTLGEPVAGRRFGVGFEGVNVGFTAEGSGGDRFEIRLGLSSLAVCQQSGSVTLAVPATQLSAAPRIDGLVASRGPDFAPSDPVYLEGPFPAPLGPGASETLLFDIDACLPGAFTLHVERLDRLSSLIASFEDIVATLTGLPRVLDLAWQETPVELRVDLAHDSAALAGLFLLPDASTLTVERAPRAVSAELTRNPGGDLSRLAFAFANTPAGGARFGFEGALLGEVSSLVVDRITAAGVLADLDARRFTFGDASFTGGPARFDRREGSLAVASGGPGDDHTISVDASALSVFTASVDAGHGVAVTLDHDGILDALAEMPAIGRFTIGKIRSAGFFVDPAVPAFVVEDAGRSGGFARFEGKLGTLLVDLETPAGLRAEVAAVDMQSLRALVDVEDEIALLVDHVGKLDAFVEAPSLGRFDIVRLPAHLAGQAALDGAGDLSQLRVELSGGTAQSRVSAATTLAGSALTGTLGAVVGGVLDLDRAIDRLSLDLDFAIDVGDLALDLSGSTGGQSFDAEVDGSGLTDLSLAMGLDTSQKVDVHLEHLGRLDLDVVFPGLAQVTATALPAVADFEVRRGSTGDLEVVDVGLSGGSGNARIDAWADLDDVSFFARIDDIDHGTLLANLAADQIDVDFRFATPNGGVEVDGQGNFDGEDVNFTLTSDDLRRARMHLANSGPLSLGANGSRTGSHLTLEIVLNFLGIDLAFEEGGFFDPAKVYRRSDGRYELVFPANSDSTVFEGECRTKGIPPDTIFTDPEVYLQLCALNP